MTTSDGAEETPQLEPDTTEPAAIPEGRNESPAEPIVAADPVAESANAASETAEPGAEADAEPEPVVVKLERRVELERSVRYGRILITFALAGAILAAMITLMFPVEQEATYTMSQVVGIMLVIGGVAGLALGAILSLILTRVAKRQTGTGVAIQTDVR